MIYPSDQLIENKKELENLKSSKISSDATIEDGAHINGVVEIGDKTIIKSGVYIEGPVKIGKNCVIGPNCYLRPYTNISDNVKIGHAVEIKNSLIGENSRVPHLSYIGDSVIGKNVNIGAGTITANLRHDQKNIKIKNGEKIIDSKLTKFGCYIGDFSKLAIHTSIYPGIIIAPYSLTLPGQIINKNIKSFTLSEKEISKVTIEKIWGKVDQNIISDWQA